MQSQPRRRSASEGESAGAAPAPGVGRAAPPRVPHGEDKACALSALLPAFPSPGPSPSSKVGATSAASWVQEPPLRSFFLLKKILEKICNLQGSKIPDPE